MSKRMLTPEEMETVSGGSDDMDTATRNREIRRRLKEMKAKGIPRDQAVAAVYDMYSGIATMEDIEEQARMIYGQ